MIRECSICNLDTSAEAGVYNIKQRFVCRNCFDTFPNLHVDDFRIEGGKVIRESPYFDLTKEMQRLACIDFLYLIFERKISPATFPALNRYIKKGYTWIGIVRAMEWFYIVKGNDIAKAKKGVGIVPYIYEEAQAYYESVNQALYSRFRKQILPVEQVTTQRTFVKKKKG